MTKTIDCHWAKQICFTIVWGCAEILPFRVFVSSTTFGHKSCISSTIDSCPLFRHRLSSHHYLYHRQNMDVRYPSSKRREPVREARKGLYASLETAIRQASGFSLLANDNSQKIHVIMPVIGNREDSIWRSSLKVLFND